MTIKYVLPIFIILALSLAISSASAQTMVAGKIYNSNYSKVIEGAAVTITCKSSSLTTTSLADGTFAVRFQQSECTLGNSVSVASTKNGLIGSGSGTVTECGDNCQEDYFVISNIAMKQPSNPGNSGSSSGGVSTARVYLCGNGKCDSGETAVTCEKDCKKAEETNNTNATCSGTTCPVENQTNNIVEPVSFGITGASVSLWDSLSLPFFVGVLAFLIIFLVGHKMIQKRKKRVEI